MTRYAFISSIAGGLDFLIALALLHSGFRPWSGIAIAMLVSSVVDYFLLEWWGFPKRPGSFSMKRLAASGLVGVATYLLRLFFLHLWKVHVHHVDPTEHLIGLAVAYSLSGLCGYLMRTRFVFAGKIDE